MAVPGRFEQRVREAEVQQVLDGLFAQVVVDAIDRRLGEHRVDRVVEHPRAGAVVAERFFDHDARPVGAPGASERLDDGAEQTRRNGQIVGRLLRLAERLA